MKISISSDAESDIADGFWFYESRERGLGDYFRSSIISDIESLAIHGGVHQIVHGYHRSLCKTFPYFIYYRMDSERALTVVAVIGQRRDPQSTRERLG